MTVTLSDQAKKQLKRLDKAIQKRIVKFLSELTKLADPRSKGKMLVGNLREFWRYRVGDYRLIRAEGFMRRFAPFAWVENYLNGRSRDLRIPRRSAS